MNDCTIAISTFQKVDALEGILKSLLDNDYGRFTTVICDDNGANPYKILKSENGGHPAWKLPENQEKELIEMPSAKEIFLKYKKEFSRLAFAHGKGRGGISINKNRGIRFFLEKTKDDYLLLVDDDILFHSPGLIEDWVNVLKANTNEGPGARYSLNQLTGTWQDYDPGYFDKLRGQPLSVSREGWYKDFPIEALGEEGLEMRKGSMGCCNLFTRKAIEAVGFYNVLTKYGYDHSLFSSRVALRVDKSSPSLFPVFDWSSKYYVGNSISNNYNDATQEAALADPIYQNLMNQLSYGKGLKVSLKDSGLNLEEEVILE